MATEREVKLLVSAADFAILCAHLDAAQAPTVQLQENRYLDLPQRQLHAARAMLRLRLTDGRAVLTLKARARLEQGVSQALELERELDEVARELWTQPHIPWRDAVVQLQPWLEAAGLTSLDVPAAAALGELGRMHNTRRVYALPAGVQQWPRPLRLELDQARFPDGTLRFELECEHRQAAELAPKLAAWLAGLGLQPEPARWSKFAQMVSVIGI